MLIWALQDWRTARPIRLLMAGWRNRGNQEDVYEPVMHPMTFAALQYLNSNVMLRTPINLPLLGGAEQQTDSTAQNASTCDSDASMIH